MARQTGRFTRLANLEQLLRDEKRILDEKIMIAVSSHKALRLPGMEIKPNSVREKYSEALIYARGILEKNAGLGLDLSVISELYSMLQFAQYFAGCKEPKSYHDVYLFLSGGFGEASAVRFPKP